MILNGEVISTNSERDFRGLYAAMSNEELLRLAAEGELRAEAGAAMAEQLRLRNISLANVDAVLVRQAHAKLQARVGKNPYSLQKGIGLRLRGKTFLSDEDRHRGIFVATRWVVLFWMSVVPIGSYRVKTRPRGVKGHEIVSKVPLNWAQVGEGWIWNVLGALLVIGTVYGLERLGW